MTRNMQRVGLSLVVLGAILSAAGLVMFYAHSPDDVVDSTMLVGFWSVGIGVFLLIPNTFPKRKRSYRSESKKEVK